MKSADTVGIAGIGLAFPTMALDVRELASHRGVDPDKYTIGLGCDSMALAASKDDVIDLAAAAAEKALVHWGGDRSRIGLLATGTETARDMSRPLSAWVADKLGLDGFIRSYEVKHACYGGTLALRQALEWIASGANRGKAALVVASDVSYYAQNDGGEPTQGAGAVAMVIDENAIASINIDDSSWSKPAFDFWRPVGDAYPSVDGPLSVGCYQESAAACFQDFLTRQNRRLEDYTAICWHVPFPKMALKGWRAAAAELGLDDEQAKSIFARHSDPYMDWNRKTGNSYTASLWVSVAHAISQLQQGQKIAAFSYGSGCGSELLELTVRKPQHNAIWVQQVEKDLASRHFVTGQAYQELRDRMDGLQAAGNM